MENKTKAVTVWIEIIENDEPAYVSVCLFPGEFRASEYHTEGERGELTRVRLITYLTKGGGQVHQRTIVHEFKELARITTTTERWCMAAMVGGITNGDCPLMPAWRHVSPFSLELFDSTMPIEL